MIRTVDALLGVCKKLRTKEEWDEYEILVDEKTDDENENTDEEVINDNPYFFVQVDMLSSSNCFKLREKLMNIYIYYIDARKTNISETKLEVMDNLTELFDTNIEIDNRHLPIMRKDYLENNTIFKMSFKYFDDKSIDNIPIEDAWDELMEVIKIKYKVK